MIAGHGDECVFCGYDLTGNTIGWCPECGRLCECRLSGVRPSHTLLIRLATIVVVVSGLLQIVALEGKWPASVEVTPSRISERLHAALGVPYPFGEAYVTLALVRLVALAALVLSGFVIWRRYGRPGLVSRALVVFLAVAGLCLLGVVALEACCEIGLPRSSLYLSRPYLIAFGWYAAVSGCHVVWLLGWAWVFDNRNKQLRRLPVLRERPEQDTTASNLRKENVNERADRDRFVH
jgi:hypothetical protein